MTRPDLPVPRVPPRGDAEARESLASQLLARRVVLLGGPLDDAAAARVAAELMWLDATGDGAVELRIDSAGGPLDAMFSVMDTVDLLGVAVHALCFGRVERSAIGVLVCCESRSAAPHARFYLGEPVVEVSGTAADMQRWGEHHGERLARLVGKVSSVTGRPCEHVEADMASGRWLGAAEAVAYGLVERVLVARRDQRREEPGVRRPQPFGFRPPGA